MDINVLSAFSGVDFLRMALNDIGVSVGNYYSSEVNPYAQKAAKILFDDVTQVGDITRWRDWGVDWASIDLITAGSPCQGFSAAGKKGGTKCITPAGNEVLISDRETYVEMKGAGAKFVSQSHLFWEFVLLLDHVRTCNPDVNFMLENVKMTKPNQDMITNALSVDPVLINAELLTAQNRERLFWCNWQVTQPQRQHIVVADILEEGEFELRPCVLREKIGAGVCHHIANASDISGNESIKRVYAVSGKAPTLTTMGGGHREPKFLVSYNPAIYRKATIIEIMRLQGTPEWCIKRLIASGISNTQLKHMIGNGWALPVISHILKGLV